jgi:aromatic-L-amino-acid decarboxylase
MHVDAAYGGSAGIVPEFRHILKGCERADSLVVNPHKWLLAPIDVSAFYTRHADVLRRSFSLVPDYLRTSEHPRALNFMEYGVPLGRRFRSLKLWFVFRYYGREGIAEVIRRHIALAQEFAAWVKADERFEVVAPAPLSLVCFRYRGSDEENRRLLEAVNATGKAFLSATTLCDRYVLRLAIGNQRTAKEHVARVWDLIREAV